MLRRTIGMIPHAVIAVKNSIYGNTTAPKPIFMQIEPSNYCNQKCIYCPRQGALTDINNANLSLDEFKQIIGKLPAVKGIMLSGIGEPLLNKDLFEMIRYAKSRGIKMQTTTNMTLITPEVAHEIVKSGLDELFVSMDSAIPEIYQKLRCMPIEAALKGLKNLTEARKELGVLNKKPKILINAVFNDATKDLDNTKKLIDLAKEHHLILRMKSLRNWGKGTEGFFTDAKPAIEEIKKYAKENGVDVKFNIKGREGKPYCYVLWFSAFINAKGDLYPCFENTREPRLGSVLHDDFESMWNGPEFRKFREGLYKRDTSAFTEYVRKNCETCNIKFNDKIHTASKVMNFWRHN